MNSALEVAICNIIHYETSTKERRNSDIPAHGRKKGRGREETAKDRPWATSQTGPDRLA